MPNKFSILYIEDDSLTQKIIVNVLGRHFSEIFVANDGVEGIKLYHEKKPDIILSDISMPKLNGIDMTKEIKRHNPKQKVALFTGYNDIGNLNKAINIGIDKYILKPLDTKQMFTALDDIVESLREEEKEEKYREKLEFVTQHDELTGLLNRRQFFFLLDKLRHRSDREKRIVAILALDLNKFKPINDTYGHEAGDEVLKKVAKSLLKSARGEDIVARFGGDEFGIAIGFLKENNQILRFLERLERNLKKPLLYVDDDGAMITDYVPYGYEDYVLMEFILDPDGHISHDDVFVVGSFNNWKPGPKWHMFYDSRDRYYKLRQWVPRARHNYLYASGKLNIDNMKVERYSYDEYEGNTTAGRQTYIMFIYYREFDYGGFDSIIAVGAGNVNGVVLRYK